MLLSDGENRYLFDYGFNPSRPPEYPMRAPHVDYCFISHAHVDHSGMVPVLSAWDDTEIYGTSPTISTSLLLMEDSIKVGEAEGTPPPYGRADVRSTARKYRPLSFGIPEEYGNIEIICHSAGHIPGATMFELNTGKTVLFTGDIQTIDTELVSGAETVKCDTLIIEGTYSGRDHPDRLKTTYMFTSKIEDVINRGGVAIVPAFAVGRTQEILLMLSEYRFEVWLDGMGQKVNRLYLGEKEYLRSTKRLRRAINRVIPVKNRRDRELAMNGEVIVTTSGMLDGGPVLSYLSRLYSDPKNAILLTGYQVEGSNGRRLVDTGTINLSGASVDVKCEVMSFDFSAHAGHSNLVKFVERCDPDRVIIMHSDNPSALATELKDKYDIVILRNDKEMEI